MCTDRKVRIEFSAHVCKSDLTGTHSTSVSVFQSAYDRTTTLVSSQVHMPQVYRFVSQFRIGGEY